MQNSIDIVLNDIRANGANDFIRTGAEVVQIYGIKMMGEVLLEMLENEGSQRSREQAIALKSAMLVASVMQMSA
jgi:hypothetical protein